jgi:putative N6-adenine-specific DNA methylase
MKDYILSATTFAGLEDILAEELLRLGARDIKKGIRHVQFTGDKGFIYKANYNLRTALRIFKQIAEKKYIKNAGQLYRFINSMEWSDYMDSHQTFRIDVTGQSNFFNNTQFVALKTKDAIVDQFRKKTGSRPNVDLKNPDIRIVIHLQKDHIKVLLDSSGESLHKRGYRTATNKAPINEVLAAGIVKLAEWKGLDNLLDPMCGSGTIPIEAAMLAMNIPASIHREKFAFQNWKDFDSSLFNLIKETSLKKIKELPSGIKITGYDKAPSAVEKAIQNVKNAGLEEFINIKQADFFKTSKKDKQKLTMIFNPPYDERLQIDVKNFYKNIGDTLKHHYPGSTAWILAGNKEAVKSIGLRPSKRIPLYNGKLEVRLLKFELYTGSKKKS